jgi:predicted dehydrogenase
MESRQKINIGVIGAGTWAYYAHFPAIKGHPDAVLYAVCQRREDKLREAALRWDIPHTFTTYQEMIDQLSLDGLIVSTPHHFHYEPAKYALERGLHVLVEKPMVLKTEQARELVELARVSGKTLQVGHPLPHIAQAQRARELIATGALGEVKFVHGLWASPAAILFRKESLPSDLEDFLDEHRVYPYNPDTYNSLEVAGGGQAQTAVSHTASLIFWLTDRSAAEVFALMRKDGHTVDAYDAISFRLDNGALGTLASWGTASYKQPPTHEFRIHGERGLLILDVGAGTGLVRWADGQTEVFPTTLPEERWPRFSPARNLVDVIVGRASPVCPGEIGLRTVAFTEAAYSSAEKGQPIRLKD